MAAAEVETTPRVEHRVVKEVVTEAETAPLHADVVFAETMVVA